MNEIAKPRLWMPLCLGLALGLGACSAESHEAPPLQGARLGGPLTLTDQNGRRTSEADFAGRYRIVYFGFTFCPDVCPVDLQQIGQAMRQIEKTDPAMAAMIQPIFVTVDPKRDTPAVLKQYVAAFHPRLIGLTGSAGEIARVAKAYGVYYTKREADAGGSYVMDHSRVALLFGPGGAPIAILPHEKGADAIAAELKRWVV
jgi:protein SCO1/2